MTRMRLKDVAEIVTGSTPATNTSAFFGGDIPFVTPPELNGTNPILSAPTTLSSQGAAQVRVVPTDAVLVCCIGSLGKIGIAGVPLATNQQINAVVFDGSKVFPRYGLHCCRLLKPVLEHMAPATTVKIVNKSRFSDLTIPVPPLPEQRRIAAILDKAEELRAKRRAALEQLNGLTEAIFAEMFGDPATNPKGWPKVALQNVFDIARGGSPRPIDAYITDDPGGINWIMISDASGGSKYITTTKKRIRPEGAQRSRAVSPGDFLLTNSMSFGRPYIVRTSGCIHDGWLVLSPRRKDVDSDYFYCLLASQAMYSEFERRAAGATVKNLNIDLVRGVTIPLAPLDQQREFARREAVVEVMRSVHRASLTQLDTLFTSLQQQAFSGELR